MRIHPCRADRNSAPLPPSALFPDMLRDRLVTLFTPDLRGPMRYALDRRTFWYSHYLSTGLRTSSGILAVALPALWLLPLGLALAMAFGASCLALVDQTGPLRSKMRELAVSLLLNTLASCAVGLLQPHPLAQDAVTLLLTFASAFVLLYGKRAMPIQFSMLLAMTLSIAHGGTPHEALRTSAAFLLGGILYFAYAMAVSTRQRHRVKQQVLAECLFELARYLDIKAGFYDPATDLDSQYTALIRQQVVLAEKQQAARDMVLQPQQDPGDDRLIQIHLGMLDLYEQVMSTHTDYAALRFYFGQGDVLIFLRDMVLKTMRDLEAIAYALTRDRVSSSPVRYAAEQRALEYELHLLSQQVQAHTMPAEALTQLRSAFVKIGDIVRCIGELHAATRLQKVDLPTLDLRLFVSRPRLGRTLLLDNLSLQSPICRYALRITLAMATALVIGDLLPYASHAYWIMLTIVIIMKPSYALTRERRAKRMLGTVLGCALAGVVLWWVRSPVALLVILYLSLTTSATFVQIRYLYTATAATLTVMILLHFIDHGGSAGIAVERLADTGIGVLIASIFSFVLPNWERQALPSLLRRMLGSARLYLDESRGLLLDHPMDDENYRLARKSFLDQIAGVNAALLRMLEEPRHRQHGVRQINQLLVRTYLITSHVAALRMMLRRHPELPQQESYRIELSAAMDLATQALSEACTTLQGASQAASGATPPAMSSSSPAEMAFTADALPGSSEHLRRVLQQRIRSLQTDALSLIPLAARASRVLQGPASTTAPPSA